MPVAWRLNSLRFRLFNLVRGWRHKSERGCAEERHLSTGVMRKKTREVEKPKRAGGPDLT
jgi:hypothetical protein